MHELWRLWFNMKTYELITLMHKFSSNKIILKSSEYDMILLKIQTSVNTN